MKSSPLLSIVIVTWNSEKYIQTCLDHLSGQTYKNFEAIVVDNGSTDNILDGSILKDRNFDLQIHRMSRNLGFAAANNIGVKLARGSWILLLNADAFPEPDWLEKMLEAAQQNPQYNFFTSRQVQYDNPQLLDGAGDEYHVSGLAWRRGYNQSSSNHGLHQREVFGACAAAAMYRREDFLAIGGLDEDYFSYFEDVDLSFRLRLAGGRCLYVPQAVIFHVGSASTGKLSDFVIYHGHRNLVWTYIKNMPAGYFWRYLPVHLLMNAYFLVSFTLKGRGRAIVKAKWDAIKYIPAVIRKRTAAQRLIKIEPREIYKLMSTGLLNPYRASRQRNSDKTENP